MKTLVDDSFDEPIDPYMAYRVQYRTRMNDVATVLRKAGQFIGRR